MFCRLLGEVQYELQYTTETGMLKLFAFVTCLIRILSCGLQTYKIVRYRQLNKRIGRLIRLATDSLCSLSFSVLLIPKCKLSSRGIKYAGWVSKWLIEWVCNLYPGACSATKAAKEMKFGTKVVLAWGWCVNFEYVHSADRACDTTLDDEK